MSEERASRNSYDFDQFFKTDRDAERARLDYRAGARIENLPANLQRSGFEDGMSILDIGSGTGRRATYLAQRFTKSSVMGIDTSQELLEFAKTRVAKEGLTNIRFEYDDINASKLPSQSFDCAYLRLVIQHMKDPVATLHKVKALVRPGGIIYLEDTDREWMEVYPAPPSWETAYAKVKAIQREKGGDPISGRKLGHYLFRAGLVQIGTFLEPVSGSGDVVTEWLENYAPTFFTNMKVIDQDFCMQSLSELNALHRSGGVFVHQAWFHAFGIKPS